MHAISPFASVQVTRLSPKQIPGSTNESGSKLQSAILRCCIFIDEETPNFRCFSPEMEGGADSSSRKRGTEEQKGAYMFVYLRKGAPAAAPSFQIPPDLLGEVEGSLSAQWDETVSKGLLVDRLKAERTKAKLDRLNATFKQLAVGERFLFSGGGNEIHSLRFIFQVNPNDIPPEKKEEVVFLPEKLLRDLVDQEFDIANGNKDSALLNSTSFDVRSFMANSRVTCHFAPSVGDDRLNGNN